MRNNYRSSIVACTADEVTLFLHIFHQICPIVDEVILVLLKVTFINPTNIELDEFKWVLSPLQNVYQMINTEKL